MQAEFVRVSHPDHDFRVAAEYAVVNLSNVVERYGTDNYRLLYNNTFYYKKNANEKNY